jgi:ribosomal protein S20
VREKSPLSPEWSRESDRRGSRRFFFFFDISSLLVLDYLFARTYKIPQEEPVGKEQVRDKKTQAEPEAQGEEPSHPLLVEIRHQGSAIRPGEHIKEVRSALESKGVEEAGKVLSKASSVMKASSVISRAGSKGVLHRKNVARKVAKLSRAVQKASAST